MLAGILFITLGLVIVVLVSVDISRTPIEALTGAPDRHRHDAERPVVAAGSGAGVHTFGWEPAVREQPVPAGTTGARANAGPVGVDSFERADQAARGFDRMRRDTPPGSDPLPGKVGTMFVNLSRRNQTLIERQLRLIEGLEHGERDEQRLASLSRLNRIAMRMHRNSQNLLVLAGQKPAPGWNQPVALGHLVEAALSEIEDYERVSVEVQPGIAVRGPAVHDTVHVLVELIHNATSFSSADMPVDIKGQLLTTGGALVDITDQGIGMTAQEMAYANHQLDNPPPPDADVPKWMGLLVVAWVGARHGIRVRLKQAERGGLTALVWLPDEILTRHEAALDPGYAAGQPVGRASSAGFAPTRMTTRDAAAARPDPAWSARSSRATVHAEPTAAVRLPDAVRPDAPDADTGVVLPQPESQGRLHGLPIFDEVESRWFGGAHEAPGPVAAPSPVPGGLPRRPSAATQAPRAVPGSPPGLPSRPGTVGRDGLTGFSRRIGWAAAAEEADPGGPDES